MTGRWCSNSPSSVRGSSANLCPHWAEFSTADFTVLSLFAGQWAWNFLFITASFMTWHGGSKNHITLSCTHVSTNDLNQHFCWGKLLFRKQGASSRHVCWDVFPAESLPGFRYLSKSRSLTLALLFCWGGQWAQITASRGAAPTLCRAGDSCSSSRALVCRHRGTSFTKGET